MTGSIQYNPTPTTTSAPNGKRITSVIPGFDDLLNQDASNIGNLLGEASPSIARDANAYFGAQSGMPGSEFIRNRGFDLYGKQRMANNQAGHQDLISLLSGVAGPNLQSRGLDLNQQQIGNQASQWGQDFGLRSQQQGFDQWMKMNQLGLDYANTGTNYLNSYMNFLN